MLERTDGLLYKAECFQIRGAIFAVYKELGCGFLESVYQECLEKEFSLRSIPYKGQCELPIAYKGSRLCQYYRADLICFDKIIVEIKAVKAFDAIHRAQVINYLRASGLRLGLLVNFCSHPKAQIERIIL